MVALLLAVGAGAWFLGGDGDGRTGRGDRSAKNPAKEHDGRFETLWKKDAPDTSDLADQGGHAYGTWFAGGRLVRALFDSVVAYDLDTGAEVWSLKVPRGGGDCAAADEVSDGRTVLQWGARCEKIMAIDLVGGEELWRDDLPSDGGDSLEFDFSQLAVSGGTATAAWGGRAVAYELATGRPLWSTAEDAECLDRGHVGGGLLIAHVDCGYGERQELQSLKPDGRRNWRWRAPEGVGINHVFSTDPVVVGVTAGDETEMTDLVVLDAEGKARSKITLGTDRYRFAGIGHELDGLHNVVVDKANDALYLQSNRRMNDEEVLVSEIVAFDLATGRTKWLSEPTRTGQTSPLALWDGRLLGYEPPTPDEAGRLTSVDPGTGRATRYAELPDGDWKAEFAMQSSQSRPHWHDGRLFLVASDFFTGEHPGRGGLLAYG
ncbi:PQQ-binding-like beta-propeller repeat protein [Streptomyces sp. TRM 70361]|uniref:outer membrane protein assembly factor BamB family protein n=1 Tax=Streptomyces sp. TRM 70361 TaxID=3116553 RepID=UPI002E7B616F|nr:PQQ-binding-like beta-propeller repeat protein [Streptomyces sp. TRM 70361]MEE1938493.1 PQQ-binding-like beta-propeller repeat protein [Streptomyces sp. TRM 70361]